MRGRQRKRGEQRQRKRGAGGASEGIHVAVAPVLRAGDPGKVGPSLACCRRTGVHPILAA
jgi:hypothetical protein